MERTKKALRNVFFYFVFGLVSLSATAQDKEGFETIVINKQIQDFPEKYIQENPLDAFVSISYIMANGKQGMWRTYSTHRFYHTLTGEGTPDKPVTDKYRNGILNRMVKECIIYKDSAAAVITTSDQDSIYLIRYLSKENGKWLNAGEDLQEGSLKTRTGVINKLPMFASFIPMIELLKQTPTDTTNFVNYLKAHGIPPHRYVVEKLAKHKVVIYGERHRRKVSWNLLQQVIQEPEFIKTTGTVFFELPSHKQKDLDRFYAQDTPDCRILLDVFGCELINGWHDKDEFDFMIALWELNKRLPENQKLKIILTDYQTPWDSIKNTEDFKNFPRKDRNTNMADVIEQRMRTTADKRNALFIVGFMHAHKSSRVVGMFSTPAGQEPALTAAAQLVERFSDEDVFCIFPHCLSESNRGEIGGRIRNGLFDYAFEANGNIPIAFDLAGSPFGREPFDAGMEVKFNPKIGSYQDNFDGYIFFQKLEDEEKGNPLYELFTDEYVEEVKRRAYILGMKEDQIWYDVPIKDLTKEIIIESMRRYGEGKMWLIKGVGI